MGASGSKTAAAQKAVSRAAAAAAAPATESAATAASRGGAAAAKETISAAERQREAAMRARQQSDPAALPAEQASQNENLVHAMNKVMAGMQQYQYQVYRNPEVDKLYAQKKKTKEDKEAELVGRLASPALKSLLEEHARAVHAGRPLAAAELARRYGADPDALQQFLRHNAGPVVRAAPDGRLVGSWPDE